MHFQDEIMPTHYFKIGNPEFSHITKKAVVPAVLKCVKNIFKNYVNPIEIDKKVVYSKSKRTNYVR